MRILSIFVATAILGATLILASPTPSKLSTGLRQKLSELRQGQTFNIILTFANGTENVLDQISQTPFPDRNSLLVALSDALEENSNQSQANVRNFLSGTNFTTDPLWVTDQLWVKSATEELIAQLEAFPEVVYIFEDELTVFAEPPSPSDPIFTRNDAAPFAEWGIDRVEAEPAVALLKNVSSSIPEVRVCTIDTGVRHTHESLRDNYLGAHGWFDPGMGTDMPNDQNGHGTHTTGTIAGSGGIGVYPDAKWQACKGCATNFCSMYDLIKCGQWVICPTLPDGSNRNCTKAPHIVSNSWGISYDGRPIWFDGVIDAWQVGHLIPVFSNGNSGPSCGTAGYPASKNVIAVGSTTSADAISSFSSAGPTLDGEMKPDVSAPGSDINSASHLGDNLYRRLSGTSMACPHVAGISAILVAYRETLSFAEVDAALKTGAHTNLLTSGRVCDGVIDGVFPNHVFGWGRSNALNSLQSLIGKV